MSNLSERLTRRLAQMTFYNQTIHDLGTKTEPLTADERKAFRNAMESLRVVTADVYRLRRRLGIQS